MHKKSELILILTNLIHNLIPNKICFYKSLMFETIELAIFNYHLSCKKHSYNEYWIIFIEKKLLHFY